MTPPRPLYCSSLMIAELVTAAIQGDFERLRELVEVHGVNLEATDEVYTPPRPRSPITCSFFWMVVLIVTHPFFLLLFFNLTSCRMEPHH